MVESIKDVLVERDGMSSEEADELIEEAKEALDERISAGDISSAEEICMDYFGLEMDYIFDLL